MSPTVGLVLILLLYTLIGGAYAFNLWGVSDRAAEHFRGKPWLLKQIGRDNPNMWRGGGMIMLTFGVAMVLGIAVLAVWRPPTITLTVAILALGIAAIASTLMLVRARQKGRTKRESIRSGRG